MRSGSHIIMFTSPRNLLLTLFAGIVCSISAAEVRADEPTSLKVFVLIGQSNMQGHGWIPSLPNRNGGKGSLEFLSKNPGTAERFQHLLNTDGSWKERSDVWITYFERRGPLKAGYGVSNEHIGPELGFGWVVGDALDDPILLVKCAWGGKSLAVDFRPPSSGPIPYSLGEKFDSEVAADPEIVGRYYREVLKELKQALTTAPEIIHQPDIQIELAGIAWHQGWNDRISDRFNTEYQSNLANLIRDLRRDLNAPALPFVIGETGMTGPNEKHPRALSLMKAQAAVAEVEEFRGNVGFVPTQSFWRDAMESPSSQGYHWNSNAESYYLIGEAMGQIGRAHV